MKIMELEFRATLQTTPPESPAVYFLLLSDVVVYVGASLTPRARVKSHRARGRVFDEALYLPVAPEDLSQQERIWIAHFEPSKNRAHNPAASKTEENWGCKGNDWIEMKLWPSTVEELDEACKRTGMSRSEVATRLVAEFAEWLTAQTLVPAGAFHRSNP